MSFSKSFGSSMGLSGASSTFGRRQGDSRREEPASDKLTGFLFALVVLLGLTAGCLIWPANAKADTIFVRNTIIETGVTDDEAQAAQALIRSAIADHPGETLSATEAQSKMQLQPRLLKLGNLFLLTLEKSINGEIVYVAQTKFPRISELDQASRRAVMTVLAEPLASYKKTGAARYPSVPYTDQKVARSQSMGEDIPAQDADSRRDGAPDLTGVSSGRDSRQESAQDSAQSTGQNSGQDRALKANAERSPSSNPGANPRSQTATSNSRAAANSPDTSVAGRADGSATSGAENPASNGVETPSASAPLSQPSSVSNTSSETSSSSGRSGALADINRSSRQVQDITSQFPERNPSRWLIGLGPVVSRRMDANQVMYGLAGAYVWDLNPFLSTKVLAEANLPGGSQSSQWYNAGVGGNYYFVNRIENAPYVTADIGYGYASSNADGFAAGFNLGLGAGYELLRTSSNPLDLSLRFSTIFSGMSRGSGDPGLYGARVSVSI